MNLPLMLECETTKKAIVKVLTNSDPEKASFIPKLEFDNGSSVDYNDSSDDE